MKTFLYQELQEHFVFFRCLFWDGFAGTVTEESEQRQQRISELRAYLEHQPLSEHQVILLYCLLTLEQLFLENIGQKIADFCDAVHNVPEMLQHPEWNRREFWKIYLCWFRKKYGRQYFEVLKTYFVPTRYIFTKQKRHYPAAKSFPTDMKSGHHQHFLTIPKNAQGVQEYSFDTEEKTNCLTAILPEEEFLQLWENVFPKWNRFCHLQIDEFESESIPAEHLEQCRVIVERSGVQAPVLDCALRLAELYGTSLEMDL